MERNYDNIRVRATNQLHEAGFLPLRGASDADAWLSQIAALCPETYALVASVDPVASVH